MSIWAVIPAKDPARAKSRLAGDLSPAARQAFSMQTLEHTVGVVMSTPFVKEAIVICTVKEPLALAGRYGAIPVLEDTVRCKVNGAPDATLSQDESLTEFSIDSLNGALTQAAKLAIAGGATGLLVVAGDIPLLDVQSLEALLGSLGDRSGLALASDRHGRGTNALFVRPPLAVPFSFGPDSLSRHSRLARDLGLEVVVPSISELALDVDTIDDVRFLLAGSHPNNAMPSNTAGVEGGHTTKDDYLSKILANLDAGMCLCESGR